MLRNFPKQKLPASKKTESWAKDCVKAAINMYSIDNPKIRQTYANKIINYNLANDILDAKDVERICNPHKIEGVTFPAKIQNYPVALPKIDLLVGEEAKRQFEWRFVLNDKESVSQKDKQKKQILENSLMQILQATEEPQREEVEKLLKEKLEYLEYDFQEIREKKANMLMKHYWKAQDFDKKFNDAFLDVLIAGEENYAIEIEAGEPILRRVNPLNIRAYRSGESPWLQDSDIIVEDGYYSLSNVIDSFYDYLTPKQIDMLETRSFDRDDDGSTIRITKNEPEVLPDGVFDFGDGNYGDPYSELGARLNTSFDDEGNILVTRVTWASYRRLGIRTFFSEDTGAMEQDIVSEIYEERENDMIQWFWVKEWWGGVCLGRGHEAIYLKMERKPSLRGLGNISKSHSGYVGLAYNINSSKAMSLLDRMKPLQYMYNVLMYRTELAFAKSHGKIMRLPLHEIPHGWSIDKYLSFAFGHNIAVYDGFKEGNKGASMGKLAGHMQQNNHVIDMEMGSYIQQHIDMMLYIKEELGEISGVSKARQGQIHQRSAVGNVNREVTQSSHITEKWFKTHDLVKKKVLETFLDIATYALKKNPQISQVVVGDYMTETFEIFPDDFDHVSMGIMVSDSADDYELVQTLKQLTGQLVQSEQISFGELATIFTTKSVSDMTRKIEQAQRKRDEREQQMQEQQIQATQEAQAQELAIQEKHHNDKIDLDRYKIDMDFLTEQLRIQSQSGDRIMDLETLRQNAQKISDNYWKVSEELDIKREQLEETKRKNKADEEIKKKQIAARSKTTATKK